jgi:hypothetical protein
MSGLVYIAKHASTAYTNAASVVFQLTTATGSPLTIHQFKLQSNALTSAQAIVICQWGYYATGTAAGTSYTPQATVLRNTVAPATTFRFASATLGTTFTAVDEFQWNIAAPWESTNGLPASKIEVQAGKVWALILPNASGTPTISGDITFEEY